MKLTGLLAAKTPYKWANLSIRTFCLLGFALARFTYIGEYRAFDNFFGTVCSDRSALMLCSKAFRSKYSVGFGLLGSFLGKGSVLNAYNSTITMGFYTACMLISFVNKILPTILLLYCTLLSILGSVYFGYIVNYVLHDYCELCLLNSLFEVLLFASSCYKYYLLKQEKRQPLKNKKKLA